MLIAHYDPTTFDLITIIDNVPELKSITWVDPATSAPKRFGDISWALPLTNEQLEAQGAPLSLVVETSPPGTDYGEAPVSTAERQSDGTWLQVWEITTTPLPAAKIELSGMVNDILNDRVLALHLLYHRLFDEVQAAEVEQAARAGAVTPSLYPMIGAVATDRGQTFAQAAATVRDLRNMWRNRANQFTAKAVTALEQIKEASTVEEAKAIYDALAAIE